MLGGKTDFGAALELFDESCIHVQAVWLHSETLSRISPVQNRTSVEWALQLQNRRQVQRTQNGDFQLIRSYPASPRPHLGETLTTCPQVQASSRNPRLLSTERKNQVPTRLAFFCNAQLPTES